MTHYIKHGNRYQIMPNGALDATEILPLGTYKVGYIPPADDYFLEKIDDFAEPVGKVYGDTIKQRDRILRTFNDRPSGTGVMLTGEKGSGKTLLAKLLSLEAQEKGIPTIVVNQAWHGDTFNAFMQSIEQPAIVVFDEFEKVYNAEEQEKLLTLLDGVYPSKKLFILTANDRFKVNQQMRNRPGRLYYRLDYTGLKADFVREYATDILADKDRVEEVVRISLLFARFNFDILKALVEEMNRYDEPAEEALALLNAKPEFGESVRYSIALYVKDVPVPAAKMHSRGEWTGNPLTEEVHCYYNGKRKGKKRDNPLAAALASASTPDDVADDGWDLDDGEEEMIRISFQPSDLKRVDAETGVFIFEKGDLRASLSEATRSKYDYSVVY